MARRPLVEKLFAATATLFLCKKMRDRRKCKTRKPSWRKDYARQQCVYEGFNGRKLNSAENPTLEPNKKWSNFRRISHRFRDIYAES